MSEGTKMALGVVAGGIVVIAIVVGIVLFSNAHDAAEARQEARGMENANSACLPDRPISIERHGAGWSNGPYWEVTCPDGSVSLKDAYP